MRVVCNSVGEFLENLHAEGGDRVLQGVVRVSTSRNPVDKYGAKALVALQVSTVIIIGEEGQYILEAGEDCGPDYPGEGDCPGAKRLETLRGAIKKTCELLGLDVRPGFIQL